MLAVGVFALVLPHYGWRAVFFVGVLPAFTVFWILRAVPESEMWRARGEKQRGSLSLLWRKDIRIPGLIATLMNACGMFGYWGLFTWIPYYLSGPVSQGGRGLNLMTTTTWLIVMGVGKWLGYALFGFFADSVGRKKKLRDIFIHRRGAGANLRDVTRPDVAADSARPWHSSARGFSQATPRSPPNYSPPKFAPPPSG